MTRFGGDAVRASSVYDGMKPLEAADIADAIAWVVMRPLMSTLIIWLFGPWMRRVLIKFSGNEKEPCCRMLAKNPQVRLSVTPATREGLHSESAILIQTHFFGATCLIFLISRNEE